MLSNEPFGKSMTAIISLWPFCTFVEDTQSHATKILLVRGVHFLGGSRCKMVDLGADCALFQVMSH